MLDSASEEAARIAHARGAYSEALTIALEAYGGELLGFLAALEGNEDSGREALADTFESMWTSLPRFEWRCSFRTWAYVIARRTVSRRRDGAPMARLSTEEVLALRAATARTTTRPYLRTENKQRLVALRESLDPAAQTLLTLRLDRGMGWEDIARVLADRELGSDDELRREAARVRKQFQRLKARLRALMEERGWIEG